MAVVMLLCSIKAGGKDIVRSLLKCVQPSKTFQSLLDDIVSSRHDEEQAHHCRGDCKVTVFQRDDIAGTNSIQIDSLDLEVNPNLAASAGRSAAAPPPMPRPQVVLPTMALPTMQPVVARVTEANVPVQAQPVPEAVVRVGPNSRSTRASEGPPSMDELNQLLKPSTRLCIPHSWWPTEAAPDNGYWPAHIVRVKSGGAARATSKNYFVKTDDDSCGNWHYAFELLKILEPPVSE